MNNELRLFDYELWILLAQSIITDSAFYYGSFDPFGFESKSLYKNGFEYLKFLDGTKCYFLQSKVTDIDGKTDTGYLEFNKEIRNDIVFEKFEIQNKIEKIDIISKYVVDNVISIVGILIKFDKGFIIIGSAARPCYMSLIDTSPSVIYGELDFDLEECILYPIYGIFI